jgi:hypothetical protein
VSDFVDYLIQYGVLGVMCLLLLLGWVVPKPTVDDVKADRDEWKTAYETEAQAHQTTRDALAAANQRAEASLETARTANAVLASLNNKGGTT